MRLPLASILFLAALSACNAKPSGQRVTMAGVTALSDADVAILHRRLDDDGLLAFLHPPTTFAAHDGRLEVRVGPADEADDDLRYLLAHQGAVAIASEFGRVWVDRSGIADVRASLGQDGSPMLQLTLTPEGAQHLSRFAGRDAIGARLLVKIDDETVVSAVIGAPLGDRFQFAIRRPVHEVALMAQLIRSGMLSFRPGAVDVVPGSRA
jgi:hypothetical protein